MTELEQKLSAFRSILNLNKHLQNGDVTETEEPPRNKCVEIEENDGRAPEYILFFLNRAHLPIQNVERKEEINDQGRCCKGFECCPTPQTPTHFTLVDLTLPSTSVPISSQPWSAPCRLLLHYTLRQLKFFPLRQPKTLLSPRFQSLHSREANASAAWNKIDSTSSSIV